jgi:DNA polymerase (family 10)
MVKEQVAEIFERIALLLELKGENPFKCRAYQSAARALLSHPDDLALLVQENRLHEIPGLGEALRQKVAELVTSGRLAFYEELNASFPATLPELFDIPGLGPKKIKALYEQLSIASLADLEKACTEGRVAALSGFGAKTQKNLLDGIAQRRSYASLHRMGSVYGTAYELLDILRACPDVLRCSLAGSFRRGKEILKDLDLLASSSQPARVMDYFVTLDAVEKIVAHGETKSSVLLQGGLACDLRVVPDAQFASALAHFTGSKEHNIALRQRAIGMGMKLSEWGLFRIGPDSSETALPVQDEAAMHRALGLDYIPPELRENLGEIAAAEEGTLPRLVEWTDLRGTFHNHTTASDGRGTLDEMAQAAMDLGLEYFGIADHSAASVQANGLTAERLLKQLDDIRAWNQAHPELHLFAGSEVDILKDGSLDFEDEILGKLDYAVASVHNAFGLDEAAMTARILRAIENPHITMLGHLTGRLLLRREPYAVNVKKIIEGCAATGTWIELNASPYRLDMDWRWWHTARDMGVRCVINPDAHAPAQLGHLRFGILAARKGWLRASDVLNTRPLREMRLLLNEKRSRH